jgi:polar amino acid transport system substrate-binding protein
MRACLRRCSCAGAGRESTDRCNQDAVLPRENNCQNSTEKAAPVGMAIDKNQPAFLQWTRAVEKEIEPQLKKDEARVIDTMK